MKPSQPINTDDGSLIIEPETPSVFPAVERERQKLIAKAKAEAEGIEEEYEQEEDVVAEPVPPKTVKTKKVDVIKNITTPSQSIQKPVAAPKAAAPTAKPAAKPAAAKTSDIKMPPFIAADTKKRDIWLEAEDELKNAAIALYDLTKGCARGEILKYYDFHDNWSKSYPFADTERYNYGEAFLRRGAQLAGVSERFVYALLKTIRLYSRQGYEALETQANNNGIYLNWTTLRVIAEKLGAKEYKAARTQVEAEIVKRKYTENELKALIAQIVPEIGEAQDELKETDEEVDSPEGRNAAAKIQQLINHLNGIRQIGTTWQQTLENFAAVTPMDNVKAMKGSAELFSQLIEGINEVQIFIDNNRKEIEDVLMEFQIASRPAKPVIQQPETEIQQVTKKVRQQITDQYQLEQQAKKRKQQANNFQQATYGEDDSVQLETLDVNVFDGDDDDPLGSLSVSDSDMLSELEDIS